MSLPSPPSPRIKAVLFDIGGVVVLSPMLAISAYETTQHIPPGYINFAISLSSPHGAWSRLERGETPLDETFYKEFTSDLTKPKVWDEYCRKKNFSNTPNIPHIDGKFLFWEMMRTSRQFDPYISPAVRKIRILCTTDGKGRRFIVGALTNDYQLPPDHSYANPNDPFKSELRGLFDVYISSSTVGMRKPEARIYQHAVQRLDVEQRKWDGERVKASEVVFLDDIGMNLKGARGVGVRGIRVVLGESWRAVRELEGVLGLEEGALFEEGVVERLKVEGKWEWKGKREGEGKAKL